MIEAEDLKWVVPVRPAGKVTMDGDLGEWDFSRPAIVANAKTIREDRLGTPAPDPKGDVDLSGEVQLAWDAQNLYLGVRRGGRPVDGHGRPEGLAPGGSTTA